MSQTKQEKKEIMDEFGKKVIEFRDRGLRTTMEWATGKSVNPLMAKKYEKLAALTNEQYELVCDLLSAAITGTIYDFLEMFEENSRCMKLLVTHGLDEYNLCQISEKMGSEIVDESEDGWVQKFSKVGRFVL